MKDEKIEQNSLSIPSEVQPYVDRFIEEGAARNSFIDLSTTHLNITFEPSLEDSLAAYCSDGTFVINQQYWDARTDLKREALIFHELGHCFLNRKHHNAIFRNDEWQSMMRGEPLPTGKSNAINYSGARRQYYIDELFDQQTPEPDWVNIQVEYALPAGSKDTVLHIMNTGGTNRSLRLPDSTDFEIEAVINLDHSESVVGLAWDGTYLQDQWVVHYNAQHTFVINAGLSEQGIIYERNNFALLEQDENLISVRKRDDKYYIFVNRQFAYWMDVKVPFVNRFQAISNFLDAPYFKEILVYELLPK